MGHGTHTGDILLTSVSELTSHQGAGDSPMHLSMRRQRAPWHHVCMDQGSKGTVLVGGVSQIREHHAPGVRGVGKDSVDWEGLSCFWVSGHTYVRCWMYGFETRLWAYHEHPEGPPVGCVCVSTPAHHLGRHVLDGPTEGVGALVMLHRLLAQAKVCRRMPGLYSSVANPHHANTPTWPPTHS